MKGNFFMLMALVSWWGQAKAQDVESFEAYRRGMLDRYQTYKEGILADYANYLQGAWERFETFKGVKRQDTPKPKVLPKGNDLPVTDPVTTVPQQQPEPQPVVKPQHVVNPIPVVPPVQVEQTPFDFYGMALKAPKVVVSPLKSLDKHHISSSWAAYQKQSDKVIVPALNNMVMSMGLNDWLTVDMVRHYVEQMLVQNSCSERILLQHTILVTMGYDVRLARTDSELLLLIPFSQMIYEVSFIQIDGRRYHAFFDSKSPSKGSMKPIYTCSIPQGVEAGKYVDPLLSQGIAMRNIVNDHSCVLSYKDMTINASVSTQVMEMFRHYPQMDIPCYAQSSILPALRDDVLKQFRPYIANLSKIDAARKLLHFVQHAFDYATDGEQHGYEKSYFVEENFYYPQNDCEDRSIFFAFLVRNLLGLDVHLVQYPGHECTAICFDDPAVQGDGYVYNHKRHVICDPTYIGAGIGMCMPNYRSQNPKIQLW